MNLRHSIAIIAGSMISTAVWAQTPNLYTQHIAAGGTWKDPTTGATLMCNRACTVTIGRAGTDNPYKVDFDDGKPGLVAVNSPDKTVSLSLQGDSPLRVTQTIVNGTAGGFLKGQPNGGVKSSGEAPLRAGAESVRSITPGGSTVLADDTTVTCNVACFAVLGSDGNVKLIRNDASTTPAFAPQVRATKPIDVTVDAGDGTNLTTYRLLHGTDTNASTTLVSTDKALTKVLNVPTIVDGANRNASKTVTLTNGARVDCTYGCNAKVGHTNDTTQLGSSSGQFLLGTEGYVVCAAGCAVTVDANGDVKIALDKDYRQQQPIMLSGLNGKTITLAGSNGSKTWKVLGNSIFSLMYGDPHALDPVELIAETKLTALANGTKISCPVPCEVTTDANGVVKVSVPNGTDASTISVSGNSEPVVLELTMGSVTKAYVIPENNRAVIAGSGPKEGRDVVQVDNTESRVPLFTVQDANGSPTTLPDGVNVVCAKPCIVQVQADGTLLIRAAAGPTLDPGVQVITTTKAVKVALMFSGGTRVYEVPKGMIVSFVDGITKNPGVLLTASTSFASLFHESQELDTKARIMDELERCEGRDQCLRDVADHRKLDWRAVLAAFGPDSPRYKNDQEQIAFLGGGINALHWKSYFDLVLFKEGVEALKAEFEVYGLDPVKGLALWSIKPNEDTNADGTSAALSGSLGSIPVRDWPGVVAVADVYTTATSVDSRIVSTANHTLGTNGGLKTFSAGTGGDNGSTSAPSVCLSSQCTAPGEIRWGTWSSGSANISGSPVSISANNKLHYIVGSATDPGVIAARTGTVSFGHVGGTVPTGADGRTYTATVGNMSITFNGGAGFTGTLSSFALTPNSGSGSYSFGTTNLTGTLGTGVATLFGTNTSGTSNLVVHGAFFGSTGNYIGAATNVTDTGTSPMTKINSVQVFRE